MGQDPINMAVFSRYIQYVSILLAINNSQGICKIFNFVSAISNTCIANFRGKLIGSMSTTKRFSYMGDSLEELMLIMNRSISLDFI